MFEHHRQPLASQAEFTWRLIRFSSLSIGIILISLGIGILGYHYIVGLNWIDSLLNASMLLGGMGAVDAPHTTAGKIGAGLYALFAGLVFISAVGVMGAPWLHRMMHRLHLERDRATPRPNG